MSETTSQDNFGVNEPAAARKEPLNDFLTDMSGMARELTSNIRTSFGKALEQSMKNAKAKHAPLVDIYETTESVVIVTNPLLGLIPGSLEVSMQGNLLTLKGETEARDSIPAEAYLRRERYFGAFTREIEIPRRVKANEARAKLRDGVLTITLPKIEEAAAHIIDVSQQ